MALLSSLPTKWVVGCATVGPVGRVRAAPGTAGSFAGVLYFMLCFMTLPWWSVILLSLPVLYVAVVFCGEAEVRLGVRDPGFIVLDEFVVMPFCYLGWNQIPHALTPGHTWLILLAGFGLFRFFDILKPLGINYLQRLPGGWGVVSDDLAAAILSCIFLHIIFRVLFN